MSTVKTELKTEMQMGKQADSPVVEKLNQLLINYQVHYQNLRLFHWNVKGPFLPQDFAFSSISSNNPALPAVSR